MANWQCAKCGRVRNDRSLWREDALGVRYCAECQRGLRDDWTDVAYWQAAMERSAVPDVREAASGWTDTVRRRPTRVDPGDDVPVLTRGARVLRLED